MLRTALALLSTLQIGARIKDSFERSLRQALSPGPLGSRRLGALTILVPVGARHNIINGPSGPMKLFTLYAPPNHRDHVVHATKADAEADEEHFDGKTTE